MSSSRGTDDALARFTYDTAGVDTRGEERGLRELAKWVSRTFTLNQARPVLPLGYFANVLALTPELGLAISTDGVGTKLLVAQQLGKYDTIGIDCIAMNVNDILCVGARPLSMVDYIAVEQADPDFLGEIGKGLYAGAQMAAISIPGGEIAQVREMIRGVRPGQAFDLVGTCVGTVHPERVLIGQRIRPGDCIVGIASSGVHSNGLTLARRVLLDEAGLSVNERLPDLGRTLGEELLAPTLIYVPEVLAMLEAQLDVKALIHITSDGFLNLSRVASETGYVIDALMEPHPIFALIQERGRIDAAEMFRVYNMGTGFCVIVDAQDAARVREIATAHGHRADAIGYTVHDPQRRVWVGQRNLVGQGTTFRPTRQSPPARPAA